MVETNGTAGHSMFAGVHRIAELPGWLSSAMKTHPFGATAAIAGVSFLGGAIVGSRVARAVVVAAAPVIVKRLLEGPLGDNLDRFLRSAFRSTPVQRASA